MSTVSKEAKTALSYAATGKPGATATPTTQAGGTAAGPPTTGVHVKGEFVFDDTGKLYYCTVGGTGVAATWIMIPSVSAWYWNGSAYVEDTDIRIFLGPTSQNPKTATGGRDQVNDVWISTDATPQNPVSLSNLNTNSADTAQNSTTFADVSGQAAILIPAVAGDVLEIEFVSTWFGNGGARNIYIVPSIAGVTMAQTQGSGYISAANFAETNTIISRHRYVVQAGDISAGTVSVKIQYKVSGNANIRCDTSSRPMLSVKNWRQ